MNENDPFKAKYLDRTIDIKLNGTIDKVFPLFDPINESKWLDNWKINKKKQKNPGQADAGLVYKTPGPNGHSDTVWTVSELDRTNNQIQYFYIQANIKLCRLIISCKENTDGTTTATVNYNFTSLSEKGNVFIEKFTEEFYKDYITGWETMINYFLATGKTLKQEQLMHMSRE